MKKTVMVLACAAVLWMAPARGADDGTAQEILALERQAMDGWLEGDPDPMLAILDPEITYIHDGVGARLEGLPAVKELFTAYRGTALFSSYQILTPKVRVLGDVAILSYQLSQRNGADTTLWNGTQVYRKTADGWRAIHTHWSQAKEQQ